MTNDLINDDLNMSDYENVKSQLGREPRGMVSVAARGLDGEILVVKTAPWVKSRNSLNKNGKGRQYEPFPTTYYLTSPKLAQKISQLEASGVMAQLQNKITKGHSLYDKDLHEAYCNAHKMYISDRNKLAESMGFESLDKTHKDFSAGGMPNRVKCLHALVAHELATNQNPIGKIVLNMIGDNNYLGKNVAAIDCGTNSIRLLIANVAPNGQLIDLAKRETRINRLGYGVDKTGMFDQNALNRTFEFEKEYANKIKQYQILPQNIRFVATSASRDAKNREQFFETSKEILGIVPEVISGDEEATLSYRGVISGLSNFDAKEAKTAVIDLGGGSTEIIIDGIGYSMDVGSVRMTERFLNNIHDDQITTYEQKESIKECVNNAFDEAVEVLNSRGKTTDFCDHIVGVAGTVTTLTAYILGLKVYDSQKVHNSCFTIEEINKACDEFLMMPKSKIRKLPFINPGRVDVISAGIIIWQQLLFRLNAKSAICSEHDILDGIAYSI